MDLKIRKKGNVSILAFRGAVSRLECEQLAKAFRKALDDGDRSLLLDFTGAPYMDSAAIGETVACLKRAKQRGAEMKLVLTRGSMVQKVIELSSLDQIFELFFDEQEAVDAF
jgi:anti-anti-sigma factor